MIHCRTCGKTTRDERVLIHLAWCPLYQRSGDELRRAEADYVRAANSRAGIALWPHKGLESWRAREWVALECVPPTP